MLKNSTLQLMYGAMEAAEKGNLDSARDGLRDFELTFSEEQSSSSEYELLTILSAVAGIHRRIGEPDASIKYLQKACTLAERIAPASAATAGDYSTLAELLANGGRLKEAISALEAAIRHLKACGEWERYKQNYERVLSRMKHDVAAGE